MLARPVAVRGSDEPAHARPRRGDSRETTKLVSGHSCWYEFLARCPHPGCPIAFSGGQSSTLRFGQTNDSAETCGFSTCLLDLLVSQTPFAAETVGVKTRDLVKARRSRQLRDRKGQTVPNRQPPERGQRGINRRRFEPKRNSEVTLRCE